MTTQTRRRFQGVRKERQWGITILNGTLTAATQAASLVFNLTSSLESSLSVNAHNWTSSAIKARITFVRTGAGTFGDRINFAIGAGWFNNDAIAAGPVSLPSPSEDDADWQAYLSGYASADSGTALAHLNPKEGFVIDNKSMRKQRENNSSLVLIIRPTLITVSLQVFVNARALFLLP